MSTNNKEPAQKYVPPGMFKDIGYRKMTSADSMIPFLFVILRITCRSSICFSYFFVRVPSHNNYRQRPTK